MGSIVPEPTGEQFRLSGTMLPLTREDPCIGRMGDRAQLVEVLRIDRLNPALVFIRASGIPQRDSHVGPLNVGMQAIKNRANPQQMLRVQPG